MILAGGGPEDYSGGERTVWREVCIAPRRMIGRTVHREQVRLCDERLRGLSEEGGYHA
jgi:hypothetical protein